MPQLSRNAAKRAKEERCISDVAHVGSHVIKVRGDDEWPEFAYTVGLFANFGQPELIVLGLPEDVAHLVLNEALACLRDGDRFSVDVPTRKLFEGADAVFRVVPDEQRRAHFGWAYWFYEPGPFPALQLIYRDRAGHLPWEAGASDQFRRRQPVLESTPVPAWAVRTG